MIQVMDFISKLFSVVIHFKPPGLIVFAHWWHAYLHRISKKIDKKKKTLLELINNYNKFAEYKDNTQKSMTFPYTSNEHMIFQIKNILPLALAPSKEILWYNSNKGSWWR